MAGIIYSYPHFSVPKVRGREAYRPYAIHNNLYDVLALTASPATNNHILRAAAVLNAY